MSFMAGWSPFGARRADGGNAMAGGGDQGGSNNSGGNQGSQNSGGGNNQGGGNDKPDADALPANIWADPAPQNNQQQQNNNQQQQTQQNPNNTDGQNAFTEYVNGLNFNTPQLSQEDATKIMQGDMSPLQNMMTSMARNIYTQAMMDANKVIQKQVERGVNDAVSKSTTTVKADNFVSKMNDRLPFTKDENIAPVAKSVMSRFIGMGQDLDTAIGNTAKYFQSISDKAGEHLSQGNSRGNGSRPGAQGFQANRGQQEPDWLPFMMGDSAA